MEEWEEDCDNMLESDEMDDCLEEDGGGEQTIVGFDAAVLVPFVFC